MTGGKAGTRCWNCGGDWASSDHPLNGECYRAYAKSEAQARALVDARNERGKTTEEAREARRKGLHGRVSQEGQLLRDAGWKFTWVSPEEWATIKEMRENE